MMRRRGGMLGMAARTAVVAGTATAVSGKVRQHQYNKEEEKQAEQQQAAAPEQPQYAPPPPAAVPAADESSVVDQIKQFAALKDQGILTEEEFAAKKAELLGI